MTEPAIVGAAVGLAVLLGEIVKLLVVKLSGNTQPSNLTDLVSDIRVLSAEGKASHAQLNEKIEHLIRELEHIRRGQ